MGHTAPACERRAPRAGHTPAPSPSAGPSMPPRSISPACVRLPLPCWWRVADGDVIPSATLEFLTKELRDLGIGDMPCHRQSQPLGHLRLVLGLFHHLV